MSLALVCGQELLTSHHGQINDDSVGSRCEPEDQQGIDSPFHIAKPWPTRLHRRVINVSGTGRPERKARDASRRDHASAAGLLRVDRERPRDPAGGVRVVRALLPLVADVIPNQPYGAGVYYIKRTPNGDAETLSRQPGRAAARMSR
jgi:hypothetical protein